jgi:uncharacterized protein YegP (UPF0339 family)
MVDEQRRGTPRFVFVSDAAPRFEPELPVHQSRFGWRVVAANNRALGRSTGVYSSLAACRAAVDQLQRRSAQLHSSVRFDVASGRWSWALSLSGNDVAQCVHPYLRRVECVRALRQFLVTVQSAQSLPSNVRKLGARALQTYSAPAAID